MARRWVAAGRRDSIALARAAMEALSPCGLRPMVTIRRVLGSEMSDCRTRPAHSQKCPIAGDDLAHLGPPGSMSVVARRSADAIERVGVPLSLLDVELIEL
jgi:hypothetical protein